MHKLALSTIFITHPIYTPVKQFNKNFRHITGYLIHPFKSNGISHSLSIGPVDLCFNGCFSYLCKFSQNMLTEYSIRNLKKNWKIPSNIP